MVKTKGANDLLRRLRRRESEAWDSVLADFSGLITSIVCWNKWHFDEHTRQDIRQIVHKELFRTVDRVRKISHLHGLIKRIAINRCVDEVRRQYRERGRLSWFAAERDEPGGDDSAAGLTDPAPDPYALVVMHERALAMKTLVDRLDSVCRRAIRMFYAKGQSYRDIGEALDIPSNAVGSRMGRCLSKLRQMMSRDHVLREDGRLHVENATRKK